MRKYPVARLEDWYRDSYFTTEIDISGSGVEDYSMSDVRRMTGLAYEELDEMVFHDSRTLGGTELRQAIANRFAGGDADRVMVTNGSTEAIYLIMKALLSPGDEVIVTDPYYHSYLSVAETIGCSVRKWELEFSEGFEPSIGQLESLVTGNTRMILVNFPHNPTGASLSERDQVALAELAKKCDAWLVWDAAFRDLIYGSDQLIDFNAIYDKVVTIHTFSKAYGLPGMRVGWCIAPPEVFEECIRIRDFTVLFMSPMLELIAKKVVEHAERFVEPRLAQAKRNLEYFSEWQQEHADLVDWVRPKGGVTVFARFIGRPDSEAFCTSLISQKNVLLTPGTCFGRSDLVRIGFGGPSSKLQTGLSRLSEYMHEKTR